MSLACKAIHASEIERETSYAERIACLRVSRFTVTIRLRRQAISQRSQFAGHTPVDHLVAHAQVDAADERWIHLELELQVGAVLAHELGLERVPVLRRVNGTALVTVARRALRLAAAPGGSNSTRMASSCSSWPASSSVPRNLRTPSLKPPGIAASSLSRRAAHASTACDRPGVSAQRGILA